MTLRLIILSVTVISLFSALLWVIFKLRSSGRSFHFTAKTSSGMTLERIDFDLIEDIATHLLTFSGFVFVVANFIVFIVTDEWAFGPDVAKGTLIAILFYFGIKIIKDLYNFAIKACEEAVPISEVKEKREET